MTKIILLFQSNKKWTRNFGFQGWKKRTIKHKTPIHSVFSFIVYIPINLFNINKCLAPREECTTASTKDKWIRTRNWFFATRDSTIRRYIRSKQRKTVTPLKPSLSFLSKHGVRRMSRINLPVTSLSSSIYPLSYPEGEGAFLFLLRCDFISLF